MSILNENNDQHREGELSSHRTARPTVFALSAAIGLQAMSLIGCLHEEQKPVEIPVVDVPFIPENLIIEDNLQNHRKIEQTKVGYSRKYHSYAVPFGCTLNDSSLIPAEPYVNPKVKNFYKCSSGNWVFEDTCATQKTLETTNNINSYQCEEVALRFRFPY